MAIEAFIGNVGGGKSYASVQRMLLYMAKGGRAVSNIRLSGWSDELQDLSPGSPCHQYLKAEKWNYQPQQYKYISFDKMVESGEWFKDIPAGENRNNRTLLVIDEATDLFDNLDRDKVRSDSTYRELFRFLRLSRHAHIDVLFICQDLSAINSRLRGLICGGWRSTDMKNFRLANLRLPFPFDVFMLQQLDRKMAYETKRFWVRKDPNIFACYESESFAGAIGVSWDGVVVGDGTIKETNKMTKLQKTLLYGSILVNVFLLVMTFQFNSVLKNDTFQQQISDIMTNEIFTASLPLTHSLSLPSPEPYKSVEQSIRGIMSFHRAQRLQWVVFNGNEYHLGQPSEFGLVVRINEPFSVKCVASNGDVTFLLPQSSFDNLQAPATHHTASF